MSVYKVLVQKFNGDKNVPFQTDSIEICADAFYIKDDDTLVFQARPNSEAIAAFSCGTWYRVEKMPTKGCECGCDEQTKVPASSTSIKQRTTETPD